MKTIITLAFASIFLVACGGGGGSSSSSSFAPANAAAFEAKFVNQILTSSSGGVTTILPNSRFSQAGTTTITTYSYTSTGANTATSSYTSAGETCTQTWTWTSAFAGSASKICDEVSRGNFTFFFGFAPTDAAAFDAKFVGYDMILSDSSGVNEIIAITPSESGDTYSKIGVNTAISSYTSEGETCTGTITWTSDLAGTINIRGACTITGDGEFRFSGSN